MTPKIVLGVLLAAITALSICKPYWIIENKSIQDYSGHISATLISVILSITLASVANINFSINRIFIAYKEYGSECHEQAKQTADSLKREMRENSWIIFSCLLVAIAASLMPGVDALAPEVVAFIYGVSIWVLALSLACTYDIYRVAFFISRPRFASSGEATGSKIEA